MSIEIDRERCNACGTCVDICPEDVLALENNEVRVAYPDECWYCGSCMMDCSEGAIKVEFPVYMRPIVIRSTN